MDQSYLADRVRCANGTSVTVQYTILTQFNAATAQAPGVDLFAPLPPGEIAIMAMRNGAIITPYCFPPTLAGAISSVYKRPSFLPGTNDFEATATLPPALFTLPCVNDTTAHPLRRCWAHVGRHIDFSGAVTYVDAVGKSVPNGYYSHLVDVFVLCEHLLSEECVNRLGPLGCMAVTVAAAASPPPQSPLPPYDGPAPPRKPSPPPSVRIDPGVDAGPPPPAGSGAPQAAEGGGGSSGGSGSGAVVGLAVGGAVGGVAVLALIAAGLVWSRRRQAAEAAAEAAEAAARKGYGDPADGDVEACQSRQAYDSAACFSHQSRGSRGSRASRGSRTSASGVLRGSKSATGALPSGGGGACDCHVHAGGCRAGCQPGNCICRPPSTAGSGVGSSVGGGTGTGGPNSSTQQSSPSPHSNRGRGGGAPEVPQTGVPPGPISAAVGTLFASPSPSRASHGATPSAGGGTNPGASDAASGGRVLQGPGPSSSVSGGLHGHSSLSAFITPDPSLASDGAGAVGEVVVTRMTPARPDVRLGPACLERVTLLPVLRGKGAYGRVVEGLWAGQRVAVKLLHQNLFEEVTGPEDVVVGPLAGSASGTDPAPGGPAPPEAGAPRQPPAPAGPPAPPLERQVLALAQEVEVLGRCDHPNVVRLFAACLAPPRPLLVMELCDTNLHSLMAEAPRRLLPMVTVLAIALDIARALEYLHPTITHRDLKPANVLINAPNSPRPIAKLSDFGLSRLRHTVRSTAHPLAGTPAYIAPECYDVGNRVVTHHADLYSFGALLWTLLAGQEPWKKLSVPAIAYKVAALHERPPLDVIPQRRCSPRLAALLGWCWEADPLRRPAAAEVAKELEGLLQQALAGGSQSDSPAGSQGAGGSLGGSSSRMGLAARMPLAAAAGLGLGLAGPWGAAGAPAPVGPGSGGPSPGPSSQRGRSGPGNSGFGTSAAGVASGPGMGGPGALGGTLGAVSARSSGRGMGPTGPDPATGSNTVGPGSTGDNSLSLPPEDSVVDTLQGLERLHRPPDGVILPDRPDLDLSIAGTTVSINDMALLGGMSGWGAQPLVGAALEPVPETPTSETADEAAAAAAAAAERPPYNRLGTGITGAQPPAIDESTVMRQLGVVVLEVGPTAAASGTPTAGAPAAASALAPAPAAPAGGAGEEEEEFLHPERWTPGSASVDGA
ncbi:hypothetical protein HYH03_003689 [Edaphochlamys debaryana]|uniref:Protein kinase domain-containing protein n=1 Tax=Edaphochlamys debaryana TaxID=47281 RepID=A0A836C2V7_9CHLO|nr:hypothetical protein HYH03_003689 [Edaphochlamys debaryana]|eukprot:KAG2498431.1 hypothetical protein HYH03_003689 [Edaphochlamys debaryana]